jgi:elongation factor Tu
MLRAEDGGRSRPSFSGYRPHFCYQGEHFTSVYRYLENSVLLPGQTTLADLWLLNPSLHVGRIFPGMPFDVTEGSRVVGRGRVVELVALEAAARGGT